MICHLNRTILRKIIQNILTVILCIELVLSCAPAKNQTYLYNADPTKPTHEESLSEYQLQPGDVLRIEVVSLTAKEFDIFKEESTNQNNRNLDPILTGYLIDSNGYISLPFVGDILVQRLTTREVREKLNEVLSEYLESPVANVRLISFNFTVMGEVIRQGKFDTFDDKINVLDALATAGGVTEYGNFQSVKLIRTEDGVSTMHYLNLLDGDLQGSDYFYVKPNDVIIVDQLKNKNFRLNSSRNFALILTAIGTTLTVILAVDNLSN